MPTRPHRPPLHRVRRSPIHGRGVFAARRIRKGTRVLEYAGERISTAEADALDQPEGEIILLFTVDRRTVVNAGRNGNDARFINHSCDPNCEAVIDDGRIYIEALRTIRPGEELTYDYHLDHPGRQTAAVRRRYACHCGAANCRGTMLEPPKKRARRTADGRGRAR